jgi:hypothetical protein
MKLEEIFERLEGNSRLASIRKVTMYFGGCVGLAQSLDRRGFHPNPIGRKHLTVTSDIETAKQMAEKQGCGSIVKVQNIPLDRLNIELNQKNPPEDIWDAAEKIENGEKIILRLVRPLEPGKFTFINKLRNARKK